MSYRLIVCFDIEADNLEGAYRKLEGQLRRIPIAWETSDEAYDEDGEEIDPDVLQKAIVSVLDILDHDDDDAARIKRNYTAAECPDCGDPIPADIVYGGECSNCGHVFTADANGRR